MDMLAFFSDPTNHPASIWFRILRIAIVQFDNYRVNMRESLQREVEENIHKAKVLKEAMKESSDRDAEIMMSADEQGYRTPNNRSNTSLNKNNGQTQHQNDANGLHHGKSANGNGHGAAPQKRSTLDRIFGRKTHSNSHVSSPLRNHQVTPHPQPSHAVNLQDLDYLPVEEEEEEVRDRSMGAGVGGSNAPAATGTEVKLHPTRAKAFSLPKSLKNLKRRIAALRAKGTDLDAERREKEERAANGGANVEEKKRFTIIRLLPWKKSPASTAQSSPSSAPVRA
ncbi:hypothetical protein BGX31_004129 [Mortierella sp. GBA43]|nr:hypothetical protein BGX31_004129 [Mortierella sp. GBA43]